MDSVPFNTLMTRFNVRRRRKVIRRIVLLVMKKKKMVVVVVVMTRKVMGIVGYDNRWRQWL